MLKNLKVKARAAMACMGKSKLGIAAIVSCLAVVLFPGMAAAIPVPAAGSFAFDVYDVVVVQVLQGPIGFVGGLATIVIGAAQLTKSWVMAILGIVAGTVIIRADTITTSLGMMTSSM